MLGQHECPNEFIQSYETFPVSRPKLPIMHSYIPSTIRRYRNQRHLTLENVSGIAGMSVQHLSEIESSKRDPRLSSIERIADAMELTVMLVPEHRLWGQVHEVLAKDPHIRAVETQTRTSTEALLRGLLFGPYGDPMYPTYASKNGRKYRYYVSKAEMRFGATSKTHDRIPSTEVEAATVAQNKTVLSSPEAIAAVCKNVRADGSQVSEDAAVMAMHRLGDVWEQL